MNNELALNTSHQTPIEIALGIDSQGRTTAKRLYEFLDLNKRNYARWCKKNIVDNPFAEENVDYFPILLNEECGGRMTMDYKIIAKFAKSLAASVKSPRQGEVIEYFTKTEHALKKVADDKNLEFLRLKASYFDCQMLLKESKEEMEKMRKQLQLLEERQNETDDRKFESTYENRIASEFFKILDDALSSEDYSFAIKPKNYHGSMEVIGVYDDKYIYMRKRRVYEIYEYFAPEPIRQQILWNILMQTGHIDALANPNAKMIIAGWGKEPVATFFKDKIAYLIKDRV